MINYIYKRAINIFKSIPVKLWGLSLLSGFLTILVSIFGLTPLISVPITVTLNAGTAMLYLDAYNGKDADSMRLFCGFKSFRHVAGGMCWKALWTLLWFLIPLAGFVFVVIKSLEYAFTPYILVEDNSVSAEDALKKSMSMTKGYKGQMFIAIILPSIIYAAAVLLLSLLAKIPFVGIVFTIISFIVSLVYSLSAPLFLGTVKAGFYDYVSVTPSVSYAAPSPSDIFEQASAPADEENASASAVKCPVCENENAPGTKFCIKCGAKLD